MTARRLTAEEAGSVPGLATLAPDAIVVAAGPADRTGPIAALDPGGLATTPEEPAIRFLPADRTITPADARDLVDLLVDAARDAGAPRVLIAWDTMDDAGLKMLETKGFRPTGAMPYFEIGPGQVEYVTGYRDPTGSVVDLARALP